MSIRSARLTDIPRILQIYGAYVTGTTATFEYTVPTEEAFTQRFLDITAQFPWLVWEEAGQVLGYAYGSAPFTRAAYSWCCEPSIYLAPEAQGKGIGRRLYAVLEEILRRQGYRVSYAIITAENQGSLAFHTRLGYRVLAQFPDCGFKHGRWLAVTWMEKVLNLVETPSSFPVPAGDIVKDDRIFLEILDSLSLS